MSDEVKQNLKEQILEKIRGFPLESAWRTPLRAVENVIENYDDKLKVIERVKELEEPEVLFSIEKAIIEDEEEEATNTIYRACRKQRKQRKQPCQAVIKSGARKGEVCGKVGCGVHREQATAKATAKASEEKKGVSMKEK